MPRVNTQKAARDYPEHGIKKGDTYYWWKFRYGGKVMSKTPPRPSQLTRSKMSAALAAVEALEDAISVATCPQDLIDALEQAASDVRDVAEEYRESRENMPESLQESPTAQECEEKADGLDEWADDMDSAVSEIEGMSAGEYIDDDARRDAAREALVEEGNQSPSDDEIASRVEADMPEGFDNLTEEEQSSYMEDAKGHASNVTSCPF